jgi:hypothetical protein
MAKRTVKHVYYLDKNGTEHPHGAEVDLSDEDAERGDALGAFFESPELEPREDPLNEQVPNSHLQGPGPALEAEKAAAAGDPSDLTKDELVERAKELGVPHSGTKAELAERVAEAEAEEGA